MRRRALATLLLALALSAAFGCGRKAKPEPLRGGYPAMHLSSSTSTR
jgi:hypothetical protein